MVNPDRVAFTLFGKDIYWYGVLMAIGILIAVTLAMRESKRKGFKEDTMLDLCLIMIPLGIIGARLYYVLFELERYMQNPISILYIWEGGLAIYGAIIGGFLGLVIYAKRKKLRVLRLADCIAPGLVLAQAIGRWGNFFNQEAFGLPVTDPNMCWFPLTVKIDAPWLSYHMFNGVVCDNPYHLATFFYESMWCLLVFIVLWSLRKKFKHDGDAVILYAILYSFERMFVEGLRGDSLWLIPDVIRISQALSVIMFIAGIAFVIVRLRREKRLGVLCWPSPLEESEQAEPSESAEPSEPAEPSESAETSEPTEPDEQAEPSKSTEPNESAEPSESSEPDEPTEPDDNTNKNS